MLLEEFIWTARRSDLSSKSCGALRRASGS
jgi:hypothetical protein